MLPANLSVIITNYNKPPEQLMECVDSIKTQTVQPKEIILVDDCSKKPHAHAKALSIILPQNVGVAKARDIGVKMSSGKLLLFVDADDKLAPDFIQQCGKKIANHDIVYPNLLLFGNIEYNHLVESPSVLNPKKLLNITCSIPVTSMMWRKVYEGLGGFRNLPVYEDWDFWIRAMLNGYTFAKANTLLWYRQNIVSRNRADKNLKSQVFQQITAPYEVVGGRLKERKPHGSQKT